MSNTNKILKTAFNNAVNGYIKEFQKRHKIAVDEPVGGIIGDVYPVSDLWLDFADLKYSIDNNIDFETLQEWQDFNTEYSKAFVKLEAFWKLKRDFKFKKGFGYTPDNFHKYLIYLRIK